MSSECFFLNYIEVNWGSLSDLHTIKQHCQGFSDTFVFSIWGFPSPDSNSSFTLALNLAMVIESQTAMQITEQIDTDICKAPVLFTLQ